MRQHFHSWHIPRRVPMSPKKHDVDACGITFLVAKNWKKFPINSKIGKLQYFYNISEIISNVKISIKWKHIHQFKRNNYCYIQQCELISWRKYWVKEAKHKRHIVYDSTYIKFNACNACNNLLINLDDGFMDIFIHCVKLYQEIHLIFVNFSLCMLYLHE